MKIFIYKIPLHPPFPTGEFPLIKGGQGVVVPSFAIMPSRKFFGTPPLKIRGGRGSYDPEEGRF
jgi:hypothetical protein